LPLYLTEANVGSLLTPADALEAVEGCFRRLAAGEVENRPRERLRLEDGAFAVMAAVDRELRLAGVKTYAWLPGGTRGHPPNHCSSPRSDCASDP